MAQGAPEAVKAVKAPSDHGVARTRLIEELGELFSIGRSTVYRALDRAHARTTS